MSLIPDLKPFLHAARICGHAPYSINGTRVVFSKFSCIYSTLCTLVNCCCCYWLTRSLWDEPFRAKIFIVGGPVATCVCGISDILFKAIRHRRFLGIIARLQRYDTAANMDSSPGCRNKRNLTMIAASVSVHACLAVQRSCLTDDPIEGFASFINLTTVWFGILGFEAILESLIDRFNHLNRLIRTESWIQSVEMIGRGCRGHRLSDVLRFHGCLMDAADETNSFYGPQLVLWLSAFWINIVSMLYDSIESFHGESTNLRIVYTLCSLVVSTSKLLSVLGMCHVTSKKGNELGGIIFSAREIIRRRRAGGQRSLLEEKIGAATYLLNHRLHVSAAGLMRVDLPLLLAIFGSITTYLVIVFNIN